MEFCTAVNIQRKVAIYIANDVFFRYAVNKAIGVHADTASLKHLRIVVPECGRHGKVEIFAVTHEEFTVFICVPSVDVNDGGRNAVFLFDI